MIQLLFSENVWNLKTNPAVQHHVSPDNCTLNVQLKKLRRSKSFLFPEPIQFVCIADMAHTFGLYTLPTGEIQRGKPDYSLDKIKTKQRNFNPEATGHQILVMCF